MSYAGARRVREDEHSNAPGRPRLALADAEAPRADDLGSPPVYAENGRRVVRITGQPVPARRRPSRTQSRIEARPDRIVLWAFLLGLFMVFMAVATANASPV